MVRLLVTGHGLLTKTTKTPKITKKERQTYVGLLSFVVVVISREMNGATHTPGYRTIRGLTGTGGAVSGPASLNTIPRE